MKHILFILFLIHFGHLSAQSGFYFTHIQPYSNQPRALAECKEGFLIAGENSEPGPHGNGFLMLLDKNGGIVWAKFIAAPEPDKYESYKSAIFHQGYFYVGGFRWLNNQRRNLLIKLDVNGNIIWEKIFGEEAVFSNDNHVQDLEVNADGILVAVSGYDSISMSTCAQLIQLDMEANIMWSKIYSADLLSSQYSDQLERISPMSDGYLLNMNSLNTQTWQSKYYIIKTDLQGNEIWRKNLTSYQSSSIGTDTILYYYSATNYKDNHVIANYVIDNITMQNQVLIEFDQNGNEIDFRKYDEKRGFPWSDIFTNQKSELFILAQQESGAPLYSQLYAIKFDDKKNIVWEHHYGVENITEFYFSGTLTSDGGVLLEGRDQHFQLGAPYFNSIIVKTDCRGNQEWDYESCISPQLEEINIFPNPFSDYFNIHLPNIPKESEVTICLYNLAGQLIDKSTFFDMNVIKMNTSNFSNGFYNCTITVNGEVLEKKKIIKFRKQL